MQPHPLERGILHVEEVQENERFQYLTKVAWAHQPRDRTVAVPSGSTDDRARPRLDSSGRCECASVSHGELPSQNANDLAEETCQLRTPSPRNQGCQGEEHEGYGSRCVEHG